MSCQWYWSAIQWFGRGGDSPVGPPCHTIQKYDSSTINFFLPLYLLALEAFSWIINTQSSASSRVILYQHECFTNSPPQKMFSTQVFHVSIWGRLFILVSVCDSGNSICLQNENSPSMAPLYRCWLAAISVITGLTWRGPHTVVSSVIRRWY